jgi:hypothetical protein
VLLVALALLATAYLALLGSLDGLPFEDMPNHLTRAVIVADLLFHGGQRFGHAFTFEWAFTPYILGDIVLAPLVESFGPYAAGRLWMILTAASLPLSVAVYLRLAGHSAYSIAIASILALYLGTDWFFLNGFASFRLAIAATLLATAAWQSHLRSGSPWTYLAFVAILIAGYLTHLAALLFSAAAAGTIAALALRFRKAPLVRLALGGLPFVALAVWHVLSSASGEGPARWGMSPARKIVRLASPFLRYDLVTEGALVAVFTIACGVMMRGWRGTSTSWQVVTAGSLSLVFLCLYVLLPYEKGVLVTYLDVRAVPVATVFALIWSTAIAESRARQSWVVAGLAIALASANVWVLGSHLRPANGEMRSYRALAARVPTGATVLPVNTRPDDGRTVPFDSAGVFATIETAAITPYIFQGGPQSFFRARAPPWAPGENWYLQGTDPGDAATIARTYDFVLAMTPFDRTRLPVRTVEAAHNESAVLLEIVR